MKKIIILIALSAVLFMGACAETTETQNSAGENTVSEVTNTVSNNDGEIQKNAQDSGDEVQEIDNKKTENIVYGEVNEVIGNLLVLNLIEMPEGMTNTFSDGFMTGRAGSDGMRGFNMEDMTEDEQEAMQERMKERGMSDEDIESMQGMLESGDFQGFTFGGGGNAADGEMSSFSFGDGEMPSFSFGDGQSARGSGESVKRELQYTGEQTEVIIPVGIPVMTYGFGSEGITETETDISSIKSGSVIMITYSDDGSIEKVLMMNM